MGSKAIPNGLREGRGPRSFQEFYDERYFTRDAPPPARPAPAASLAPPRQERRPAARTSPAESFASNVSMTPSAAEEKKKKKGLFRF
jgi:syntaxin-binding protein 1